MRVSNGWNLDYGRLKFDIELDEGNLKDLLDEHSVSPDVGLTVAQKFYILNNEGKSIALSAYARSGEPRGEDLAKVSERAAKHHQAVVAALEKISKKAAEEASESEG